MYISTNITPTQNHEYAYSLSDYYVMIIHNLKILLF